MPTTSVSVVIPAYNMAWCLERAVRSCLDQSFPVREIVIADDASPDDTAEVVRDLASRDARVRHVRRERNGGPLAALRSGLAHTTGDWVALLDADDELTPSSIESRVVAAGRYFDRTETVPQLVYGDLQTSRGFKRLEGDVFPFLCKELCLCQTSVMLLGRECLPHFPTSNNPYNTDDEIVLAIGKRFHVLHSGAVVAIMHSHGSPTRVSRNSRNRCRGVYALVREHRRDIVRVHGVGRLFLWYLRVLKTCADSEVRVVDGLLSQAGNSWAGRPVRLVLRAYRTCARLLQRSVRVVLRRHFEYDYF